MATSPSERPPFRRLLIANRGEIAVRIVRACRDLGIETVAVYSEPDRRALHVRLADHAYPIGPAAAAESYLRIDRLLDVARTSGAEAIHPGYGFLSERADFARACTAAGLVFVGPSPEAIDAMGDKLEARRRMLAAGVPVVPGSDAPTDADDDIAGIAAGIGYPVMLKAAAGGGGKGMRLVDRPDQLARSLRAARSEARSAFGDDRVYVEKALARPRHVEVQVLGDQHGDVIHLYERECSIQRRHQKVIEEAPSPALDAAMRDHMGHVAVQAARAVRYVGAGTVEFLVDGDGRFYFLEMNTRIQVEHAVTEAVTGIDLVRTQIEIAGGRPLRLAQEDVVVRGSAIECRIYAEDPWNRFLPSPGRIVALRAPAGPGIRDDSGVYEGAEISTHYDPMISKLIAWGRSREEAIARMRRALREYVVLGPVTNLAFHRWALGHPAFRRGEVDTDFVAREFRASEALAQDAGDLPLIAAAIAAADQAHTPRAAPPGRGAPRSAWTHAGRREGLRG